MMHAKGQRAGILLAVFAATVFAGALAAAEPDRGGGRPEERPEQHAPEQHAPEPHAGPHGYHRVTPPRGATVRPSNVDRGAYQHNYQAARSYRVGPFHPPEGWTPHHWGYGEILPRAYWAPEYRLSDYWLFALEVPPVGFEWVRDGNDALLVNIDSGEILQVEYGVFG